MSNRTFSQEEIDYILSYMDKSTDYCTTDEDYQFDEKIRKKLDMLKSEVTTKELVSELRRREGVEVIDVPVEGESQILMWDTARPANDVEGDTARYNGSDGGPAIILKITD